MLKSPVIHPISAFLDRLQLGHKLKQSLVVEIMDYHLDRWQWKQATDYIEVALSTYLLASPQLTLNELRAIQDLVPDHTVRSLEQMELQQFSTPLELAWLVAKAAGMTATDILLEPSAGTGILPSMAINYSGSQPSQIYLNEFSKFRRELLPQLFPNAHLSAHNAEFINDYLPRAVAPTLIIIGNLRETPRF
jgi:hypothetical protein